jgi:predicted Zn-dependent peptidase
VLFTTFEASIKFCNIGLALISLGLAGSLSAQTEIDYQLHTLDNGLDVILHEDHSTPVVAVSVLYHVGSKNERPGRSGFAHFFEHLMFEGSENIDRGQYMKLVQSNGGNLNANTSFDRTFYYQVLPSNQLELGLWLESERMLHARVDTTGVETQREVVKEEKRLRIDNQPYMSFQEEIFDAAFGGSYYGIPPIGTFEDINAANITDFEDFYNTFYVPNNATLSIAGDIDPEETLAKIKQYFGEIPRGKQEIPRPDEKPEPLAEEKVDTVYDNIQLPGVFIGYRTPAQGTKEAYAVDMLAKLLSDGQSSRLYKRIVDEEQLAVTVQAFPYTLENAGLFITFGIVNQGVGLDSLVQSIDAEFAQVRDDKISQREYTKILNQLESDFVRQNSRMAGIAENLANYHVYYGDASLINNEIEEYRAITPAYLKKVAQKYLVPENRVVLYYLPENEQ